MDKYDLFKSLSEIDDDALLAAEGSDLPRKKHPYIKILAACLMLVLCIGGFFYHLRNADSSRSPSLFSIVAYAENGVLEEYTLHSSFLNSGGTDENIFGVDVPLFDFTLQPSRMAEDPEEYTFFDFRVSVSIEGKSKKEIQRHVLVGYSGPAVGSDVPYQYFVLGWFEEDTVMTITFSDAKTGDLLEEHTVLVQPLTDSQTYRITVTNITTHEQK